MNSNGFGEHFSIVTFGESHGPAIGVVIDGLRPNLPIDTDEIQREMRRRRPGQSAVTTTRSEEDEVRILSGVFEGRTTGAPMCIVIENRDAQSHDYDTLKDIFRPGHGDYAWLKKYGIRDWRGGGRQSGRETAARVAAGSIARQCLRDTGVTIVGHTVQVGAICATTFDADAIETNPVRCADVKAAENMEALIMQCREEGNSIGGIIEMRVSGVPAGWGDPVFDKLEARLAWALMSIGAVKGIEFGDGFALAAMHGLEANDVMKAEGDYATHHAGGISGGISNGDEIVIRLAIKPASSISIPQPALDKAGQVTTVQITGRHDPCICPRVVPVAEAMVAIVLADAMLQQAALRETPVTDGERQLVEERLAAEASARRDDIQRIKP